MKKVFSWLTVFIMCFTLSSAIADRSVNSEECSSMEEFNNAIETGTIATATGYVHYPPNPYTVNDISGYKIGIRPAIKGCEEDFFFMIASEDQAKDINEGDYITVCGRMINKDNEGKFYYANTQIEEGYVKKLEHPEPAVFELDNENALLSWKVEDYKIGDIAKGENLKVVKTQDLENKYAEEGKQKYYGYYLAAGDMFIWFYAFEKDLFKGDIINFEGIIRDYNPESKVLECNDSIYTIVDQ